MKLARIRHEFDQLRREVARRPLKYIGPLDIAITFDPRKSPPAACAARSGR